MITDDDIRFMRRALAHARAQHGRTGENPSVGCLIVASDGRVLSEGATGDGGRPHAEELALRGLIGTRGATAYVTLEPCRQRSAGTASCSERLIEAGIARVVCAVEDRHPLGQGGLARLRDNGVVVEVGCLGTEALVLYSDFFRAAD